ncbi:MAG: nuclear transport factor 2 family protein [Hyphomicrobiaceae bacterium]
MTDCSADVIYKFCAAYADRNFEACLEFCTDDVIMINRLDQRVVPFAGVTFGKRELLRRYLARDERFELPEYEVVWVHDMGRTARSRSRYVFRHRRTGVEHAGMVTIDWMFRGGRVMRKDQHHDRHYVEAYHRLVASMEKVDAEA